MELELAICWVIFSFLGWIRGCTPRGNAEDFENKRVAGKAIRKTMKTKGRQTDRIESAGFEVARPRMTCRLTSADGKKAECGQDFGRSRFTLRDGKSEGNWSEVQKSITVRKRGEALG